MLIGGVVKNEVENDLNVTLMTNFNKLLKILLRTELGIDLIIIRGVVLMVGGGYEYGRKPETLYSEIVSLADITIVEIIHSVDNASEIADTIAVAVREGAYEDLIKGPVIIVYGVNDGIIALIPTGRH